MTKIRIAHSPDADDAFMFAPLLQGKIPTEGLEFEETRGDIETLNQKALEGTYEVTAISFHAYPSLMEKYNLLSTGACFGDNYGPMVVAPKAINSKQLVKLRIGVPGRLTTAFLALKLYVQQIAGIGKPGVCYSVVPFDQIMDQVAEKKIEAGLIIHEGQLSYADRGLHKVVDLGEWWHKKTKLPLPLGGIAIRSDLDMELQVKIGRLIRESIRYALEHQDEILPQAVPFARGLDPERAQKFISMYVNDYTLDMGRKGFKALKKLFEMSFAQGFIAQPVLLEECYLDLNLGRIRGLSGIPEEQPQTSSEEVGETAVATI